MKQNLLQVVVGLSPTVDIGIRFLLQTVGALILLASVIVPPATPQAPASGRLEQFRQRSRDAEAAGLAEPFIGITATGQTMPGLFGIRSTGVSTESIRRAADEFLAALSDKQRDKTMFGVDDSEWRKWMSQHFYIRQGVSFKEMTEVQRGMAFELLRASLSTKGLKQIRDIMRLNHTVGELNNNNFEEFGEDMYHLTIMGKPSANAPWGWQLDGHHAVINYFVLGDQVVMTPYSAGSEPVIASSGRYKGTAVLQAEQDKGLEMVNGLNSEQRTKAILQSSKNGNNNLTEEFKDNGVLDYAGVHGSELSNAQRQRLLELIGLYLSNMREGHAQAKMYEVQRHLDNTWFAWVGGTDATSVFYYRIHSPVLLIEFDHQLPTNPQPGDARPSMPTRQHIHVVVRTPNGNDYGKDLLRQHNQRHKSHH